MMAMVLLELNTNVIGMALFQNRSEGSVYSRRKGLLSPFSLLLLVRSPFRHRNSFVNLFSRGRGFPMRLCRGTCLFEALIVIGDKHL